MPLLIYPTLGLLLFVYSTVSALTFEQPDINDGFANRTFWSITQDQNKFIWLATTHNVLKYDGYEFEALDIPEKNHYKKRTLHVDSTGKLWIGTEYGEVFTYQDGDIETLGLINGLAATEKNNNQLQINQITSDKKNNIYFASNNGLYIKPINQQSIKLLAWKTQVVKNILFSDNGIYAAVSNKLYQVEIEALKPSFKKLIEFSENEIPRILHETINHGIFVGTTQFLYRLNLQKNAIEKISSLPTNTIVSMASDERRLWVGSLINGLYAIDWQNNTTLNYQHTPDKIGSISDNVIISLLLDQSGVLFIATFDGNVSITNTNSISFGAYIEPQNQLSCLKSKVIYHIYENSQKQLWLSTAKGVVRYSHADQSCIHYGSTAEDVNSLSYPEIRSVNQGQGQQYWIATNNGLNLLDAKTSRVDRLTGQVPALPTLFSFEKEPGIRLIGTESGLYQYHIDNKRSIKVPSNVAELTDAEYFTYDHDDTKKVYLATSSGIAYIQDNQTYPITALNHVLGLTEIKDIHIQDKDIWISTLEQGLYHFDHTFELIKHYQIGNHLPTNTQLMDILQSDSGDLWVSSLNGLYRINPLENRIDKFYTSDGLQGNTFKRGASYKNRDNKLYFGGLNGVNGFYPSEITPNNTPPAVVITQLNRFNKEIIPKVSDNGFLINHPINTLKELTFSHKDYIFGFEFAALSYADPMRNHYAYMLEGLDPDWNHTTAQNRRVTYTNLKPGSYTFKVKAANKDGIWNETPKTIAIRVKPAPWYSWWAYSLYIILIILMVYGFINRRIRTERIISTRLEEQVNSQTQKINQQNETLKTLMQRKDALFANVSHEFRTPLTLILGPVDTLIKEAKMSENQGNLSIIKRNAEKLLNLVDQLLLLAKFSEKTEIKQQPQNILTTVQVLLASFEHAIADKDLQVETRELQNIDVKATTNALQIIIGNLLSNAIKYTPTGGYIKIGTLVESNKATVYIKDSGAGITEDACSTIFERFTRLSQNQTIEGVGLGLALSQEVAKANNSVIEVKSKPGHGSTFSVTFKLTSQSAKTPYLSEENLLKAQQSKTSFSPITENYKDSKYTILIIEDNIDMRHHLNHVLSPQFNTLMAENGKTGLAMALETIPDIILCDVMMPQMDGFEVSRIIRSDSLTSHIPLVLLTALDESTSRIKGWRENIDMYLTKPFDAKELNLQLKNILNIRKIINQKVKNSVINNDNYSDLCEVDQDFITKLKATIEDNYQQPLFGLTEMAGLMFKSERHLQRKSKALIGVSPTDLLREYRLNQGAKKLLNGHSVSSTSDQCGFNSVTYFSSSFKKKYGHSPKQYQSLQRTNR